MTQYQHPLIKKAVKHYRYDEPLDQQQALEEFWEGYQFNYKNYKKDKYNFDTFITTLDGLPDSTHEAAKKLLWQGSDHCWKYFDRTALFWTVTNFNDEWLDHLKNAFEYALYVERNDLLELLIQKTLDYLRLDAYKTSKDHKKQLVYPSTQLVHFLTGKWLGNNPAQESVAGFGKGYGIYQPLIDSWDSYANLESSYWDSLCEYHLDGLSLIKADKWEYEEFIGAGLVPMELINLFKVRIKLGLDIPEIRHELFRTPMAADPVVPTGYDERFDVLYQTVKKTAETKQQYTYEGIVTFIKETYGASDSDLFL